MTMTMTVKHMFNYKDLPLLCEVWMTVVINIMKIIKNYVDRCIDKVINIIFVRFLNEKDQNLFLTILRRPGSNKTCFKETSSPFFFR